MHSSLHLHFGTIYTLYSSSPSILSLFASVIFINTSNVVICSFKLRKLKFLRGEDSNSISKLTETFPPSTPPFRLIIYDHINYLPAPFCVNENRKIWWCLMPAIEADILIFCYCLRSTQFKLEAYYCDFLCLLLKVLKYAVVFYFEWKLSCFKSYISHIIHNTIKITNFTIPAKQCWNVKHLSWNQDSTNTIVIGGNLKLKYMRNRYIQHTT